MYSRRNFEKGTLSAIKLSHNMKLYLYYNDELSLWYVSAYPNMYFGDDHIVGLAIPKKFVGNSKLSYQILCDWLNDYVFN